MGRNLPSKDAETILRAFERVSERGWGLALGVLAALVLFLATAVLVVKGGPNPGPHLQLLGVYFPGYRISWGGAFLGAAYAFVLGYAAGHIVGALYNRIVEHS